ncbi:unnamed protein product [Ambrosiozyma monospora]|uniref:Unnamed protein product n=1 Tax=Ambrosiozyma monospora TaxID=43982 RepID=A0A9W7DI23_AMBMO|nr:unnamed protein product [Ambrosiozyma monospora]
MKEDIFQSLPFELQSLVVAFLLKSVLQVDWITNTTHLVDDARIVLDQCLNALQGTNLDIDLRGSSMLIFLKFQVTAELSVGFPMNSLYVNLHFLKRFKLLKLSFTPDSRRSMPLLYQLLSLQPKEFVFEPLPIRNHIHLPQKHYVKRITSFSVNSHRYLEMVKRELFEDLKELRITACLDDYSYLSRALELTSIKRVIFDINEICWQQVQQWSTFTSLDQVIQKYPEKIQCSPEIAILRFFNASTCEFLSKFPQCLIDLDVNHIFLSKFNVEADLELLPRLHIRKANLTFDKLEHLELKNHSMTKLSVKCNFYRNVSFSSLTALTHLTLDSYDNMFTLPMDNRTMKSLPSTLKYLKISRVSIDSNPLKIPPNLTQLSCSCHIFSNIVTPLPKLEKLTLEDCEGYYDDDALWGKLSCSTALKLFSIKLKMPNDCGMFNYNFPTRRQLEIGCPRGPEVEPNFVCPHGKCFGAIIPSLINDSLSIRLEIPSNPTTGISLPHVTVICINTVVPYWFAEKLNYLKHNITLFDSYFSLHVPDSLKLNLAGIDDVDVIFCSEAIGEKLFLFSSTRKFRLVCTIDGTSLFAFEKNHPLELERNQAQLNRDIIQTFLP